MNWHTLGKDKRTMRITIKHITLALGIIVALVAAIMFFANDSVFLESRQAVSLPQISLPKAATAVIKFGMEIFL